MLPEVFNQRQINRIHYSIWFVVVLVLVIALRVEWRKVNEKADDIAMRLTIKSLNEGAVAMRQMWELNNRPATLKVDDIDVIFTAKGWPRVEQNNSLDCYNLWRLLSPANIPAPHISMLYSKEPKSVTYESCVYEISAGKWLELFYGNETIKLNDFVAEKSTKS